MSLNKGLHLGIDATNLGAGGGLTHLSQLLMAAQPQKFGFSKVTVWASSYILLKLPNADWIEKKSPSWTERSYPIRAIGQFIKIPAEVQKSKCDILFAPGAIKSFFLKVPYIVMSHNLLPFDKAELKRFGIFSTIYYKLHLIRLLQKYSFSNADGLIFLTNYARKLVLMSLKTKEPSTALIPHGIEKRFISNSQAYEVGNLNGKIKLLYVSSVMPYKHQISVIKSVKQLRDEGFDIEISFIGSIYGSYGRKFLKLISDLDPIDEYLHYVGEVDFQNIHTFYKKSDIFVFASSCENLPNILIEAMSSGLPIACSNCGPMPEVLGRAGLYFNPDLPSSISDSIRELILNNKKRQDLAALALKKSTKYSWEVCAEKTFKYISESLKS